jgi:hypothetical protein
VSATVIGSGMANTTTADATCRADAIQSAADYANNGKSDWHLPSKDELNELFKQRDTVLFFAGDFVWSSSEASAISAWIMNFSQGYQGSPPKYYTRRVRPVRAF